MLPLLLLACAGKAPDSACPTDTGTELCPIDACAQTCADEAEVIACCVAAHGYGVSDEDDLKRLEDDCPLDDCSPDSFISRESALCIAQSAGLPPGIASCTAWVEPGADSVRWFATSTQSLSCTESGALGEKVGDMVEIDARSGEIGSHGLLYSTIICP